MDDYCRNRKMLKNFFNGFIIFRVSFYDWKELMFTKKLIYLYRDWFFKYLAWDTSKLID